MKQYELEEFFKEEERLDREWAEANPDLVRQGFDRELDEAWEEALEKD
ncbi:MAG TPA: hypothetical protein VNW90_25225 [Acetobacteraceae bacterium]|nr:hypothetical protein [Acetobacteraceae bacterium]